MCVCDVHEDGSNVCTFHPNTAYHVSELLLTVSLVRVCHDHLHGHTVPAANLVGLFVELICNSSCSRSPSLVTAGSAEYVESTRLRRFRT